MPKTLKKKKKLNSKKKLDVMKIVLAPLYELGNTPRTIARSLERRGIKGYKKVANSCPLARVLSSYYCNSVNVGMQHIEINGVTMETPMVFADFINDFDTGNFPNLDEDSEEEGK